MGGLKSWSPFKFFRKKKSPPAAPSGSKAKGTRALPARPDWFPSLPMMGQWLHQFDRSFFDEPFERLGELDQWFGDFSPMRFTPRVDVTDEARALKITAELPGMSKDDVTLTLQDGRLIIHGEKRHEEETTEMGVYRSERYYGAVHRTLPLPDDVDQEQAEATFDKGVLTVRIPKRSTKKPERRRIEIT